MFWLAQAVLLGWLPLVMVLFLLLPPRRAVVVSLIASWLFLPQLGFPVKLVPDYDKMSATCYAIILGALLLDPKNRVLNFKFHWIDIPIIVWCIAPFMASVTNDLGMYDGMSNLVRRGVEYAMPYLIGRLYFQTPEDMKEFAVAMVIGGLIYVPLCLYEARMSPNLHENIYGFRPFFDWQQAKRWGGFRPTVFMKHGLAVAGWMSTTAVLAFWLWRTRAIKGVFNIPMVAVFGILAVTTFLCKSAGALMLMVLVIVAMMSTRYLNTKILLMAGIIAVPTFLLCRTTGVITGEELVKVAASVSENRSKSLQFRLDHENAVVEHTAEKPLFGWGGWRRAFDVYLPDYNSLAVPDSFWVHSYGQTGYAGLISLYTFFLLPPGMLLFKMRLREWNDPRYAAISGMAMSSLVYSLDCLFNAMLNPIFVVAMGGLAGMAATLKRSRAAPSSSRTPQPIAGGRPVPSSSDEATDGDQDPLVVLPPGGLRPSRGDTLGGGAG